MKKIKRFASILLALVMCIACSIPALAVDTIASEKKDDLLYNAVYEVSDSGVELLRSSINGYGHTTLSGGAKYMYIPVTSSGIGGMGITVKTTCSAGTYDVDVLGMCQKGDASGFSRHMTTNSQIEVNNLLQFGNVTEYIICMNTKSGTPNNQVEVWIYG